ncbi:hypothetical protein ATANTOWER_032744 [Ataeniobius toweri]|uniref:Uncharacterized protein n=1 Tax=Ataeniobius toweri TaxID=208326 RepID=A0ABU7AME3_9TELE|nr:hypothetical protein [Ataeniobius toweri]
MMWLSRSVFHLCGTRMKMDLADVKVKTSKTIPNTKLSHRTLQFKLQLVPAGWSLQNNLINNLEHFFAGVNINEQLNFVVQAQICSSCKGISLNVQLLGVLTHTIHYTIPQQQNDECLQQPLPVSRTIYQ